MPFIFSAALLLWENISFFSIVQLQSTPVYVYTVNNAPENRLIQCHDKAYIYLLQHSVTPVALSKEFDCEKFLEKPISLQSLYKSVNTHHGTLPPFSRIVRFSKSASSFSFINLISPSSSVEDFTANNYTNDAEKEKLNYNKGSLRYLQYYSSSWFMGVEGEEYSSLVVSDIDYFSLTNIQQQHTGLVVQLSHLNLITLDARMLHYESFATDFSSYNSTENSRNEGSDIRYSRNTDSIQNSNHIVDPSGNNDTAYNSQNNRKQRGCKNKRSVASWTLAVCQSMSTVLSTRISRYSSSSYGYTPQRPIPFMVYLLEYHQCIYLCSYIYKYVFIFIRLHMCLAIHIFTYSSSSYGYTSQRLVSFVVSSSYHLSLLSLSCSSTRTISCSLNCLNTHITPF